MLTQQFRPVTFKEVVGNEINSKLLLALARKPDTAPSTLLLSGSWGSGKTTSARIFARALNCSKLGSDLCGKCFSCTQNILESPFYTEYDSSIMGNVDSVRELRDSFFFKTKDFQRVICLDEIHLVSKSGQSALLKVFEETPKGVFFCLCTTDPEKVLPTIRSRSLELNFTTKSYQEVYDNIELLSKRLDVQPSPKAIKTIALRSRGHMRDAHMLLDKFRYLGEDEFVNCEYVTDQALCKYVASILFKDKTRLYDSIKHLLKIPVATLKVDYQNFFLTLTQAAVDDEFECDPNIRKLAGVLAQKTIPFVKLCLQDWVMASFCNDIQIQTALLAVYQSVTKEGLQ